MSGLDRRIDNIGEMGAACFTDGNDWTLRKRLERVLNMLEMKRRTFRNLKSKVAVQTGATHHHHVYVVLLDSKAAKSSKVRKDNPNRDPAKACVYVGMTGLQPAERFQNHKQGIKAARVVQRHGLKLLPKLYECLNPMPFEAAAQMERDLAEDLRNQGYTVTGGY